MFQLSMLVLISMFWLQASVAQETSRRNATMADTGDRERGRAIVVGAYSSEAQSACFRCHGMDGRGDAAAAFPRLTDQLYKYLYDSMKDYASGVRDNPIMSPIARALTEQQMRDVSAYYAQQKNAPYGPLLKVDLQLLQAGGTLAAVGSAERGVQGCINCHGPDGAGLPPTFPYLAGQHAIYLESQLSAWKTGRRKGDSFRMMEKIAKRLSDEDIRAVSAYYASIRKPMIEGPLSSTTSGKR